MVLEDYSEIVDQNVVFEHSVYLIESFNKWVEANNLQSRCFKIHPELVAEVSLNLFVDIQRIKNFHKMQEVNSKKFAAYQAAWIVRVRPIQITDFEPEKKKYFILANELFALHTVLARMYNVSIEKHLTPDRLKDWTDFLEKLVYHFHHRITNPQALELTFEAFGLNPTHPSK
jgi:hypothetical protein